MYRTCLKNICFYSLSKHHHSNWILRQYIQVSNWNLWIKLFMEACLQFFFKGKTWKLIFSDGVANYRFMSTRWLFFLRIVPNKLIDQTGWRRSRELNLRSSGREHAMYILALIATLLQEKDALFNAHFSII